MKVRSRPIQLPFKNYVRIETTLRWSGCSPGGPARVFGASSSPPRPAPAWRRRRRSRCWAAGGGPRGGSLDLRPTLPSTFPSAAPPLRKRRGSISGFARRPQRRPEKKPRTPHLRPTTSATRRSTQGLNPEDVQIVLKNDFGVVPHMDLCLMESPEICVNRTGAQHSPRHVHDDLPLTTAVFTALIRLCCVRFIFCFIFGYSSTRCAGKKKRR